jgi:hypothetical protein
MQHTWRHTGTDGVFQLRRRLHVLFNFVNFSLKRRLMYEPVGVYHGMPGISDLGGVQLNLDRSNPVQPEFILVCHSVHPLTWPTLPPGSERIVHVLPPRAATDDEGSSEEENNVPPPAPSPDAASSSSALRAPPRLGQPTFTRDQLAAKAADMGMDPAELLRMLSSDL